MMIRLNDTLCQAVLDFINANLRPLLAGSYIFYDLTPLSDNTLHIDTIFKY